MSCDDIVIKAENMSKCFEIYKHPEDRLKQLVLPNFRNILGKPPKNYYEPFWALQNISFEMMRGQTVGILGQNGSGKSTLLQIVAGILTPTSGKIDIKGGVGALLELGSGFNPEFTGRENVYISGSLLGLTNEELERKFDQIAIFADIGEHLERPVKTYSSGMMLRLAFSVQMAVEPDILIIDEALAVGDARFQLKCFKRLEELKSKGTTILFVSHAIELHKAFCDKSLVLNYGKIIYWGTPKTAASKYYEILFPRHDETQNKKKVAVENIQENFTTLALQKHDLTATWGAGGALLKHANLKGVKHPNILIRGSNIIALLQIQINHNTINAIAEKQNFKKNLFVGIRLDNTKGIPIFDIFHEITANELFLLEKEQKDEISLEFEVEIPDLQQGNYFVTFGVAIGTLNHVTPLCSSDNAMMVTLEHHNEILGQMRPKYSSKKVLSWDM